MVQLFGKIVRVVSYNTKRSLTMHVLQQIASVLSSYFAILYHIYQALSGGFSKQEY